MELPTEPPVLHDPETIEGRAQKFLMDVTALMGVSAMGAAALGVAAYVGKRKKGKNTVK